jgi:undecaprenyl-diphosphatase
MDFSIINEIILAIVLGIVQGITEFFPISSTAHIFLVSEFLTNGRDIGIQATNILQLGTVFAVMFYFWSDIQVYWSRLLDIISNTTKREIFLTNLLTWWNYPSPEIAAQNQELDNQLKSIEADRQFQIDVELAQIIIATIPIVLFGIFLTGIADQNRNISSIAIFMIVGSVLMGVAELANSKARKFARSRIVSKEETILVGLFQVLAILPGMSRSGSTISGALFTGRERSQAVRFSFLISIPALLIAGLVGVLKLIDNILQVGLSSLIPSSNGWTDSTITLSLAASLIGLITSFIFGYLALRWLIAYLSRNSFTIFIIYRLLLAGLLMTIVYFPAQLDQILDPSIYSNLIVSVQDFIAGLGN